MFFVFVCVCVCFGGDILKRKYWRGEEGIIFFFGGGGREGGDMLKGIAGEGRRVFYFWLVVGGECYLQFSPFISDAATYGAGLNGG